MTSEERTFVEAFEACTLPAEHFRHGDHVRLAWLYLRQHTLPETLVRFSGGLQRFARAHGADGLYHETITFAFLCLINERIHRADATDTWEVFAARNVDLMTDWKALLDTYYCPETLSADLARQVFVLPDRVFQEQVG